jgi:uncharacterized protein (TIGR03083 family)
MEHAEYLDAADHDLVALCDAVAAGPLDTRVPSCPDFDIDDLARHVGAFCLRWSSVLRDGRKVEFRPVDRDDASQAPTIRAAWLREVGDRLIEQLRALPGDAECWSWYPSDQTARFIARRVANELCMHRVDAQLARGDADPIDPALAADGIDEIFLIRQHHSRFQHDPVRGSGRTMHLHGTDGPPGLPAAEWMVTLAADGLRVTREHAKGDLALRGAVGDLERLLYQRPTAATVEMFGDATVLDELHELFTF